MKEYVQSSRMDQCSLTPTSEEQYVNIEILEQLIRGWHTPIFIIEQLGWCYPCMAEEDFL